MAKKEEKESIDQLIKKARKDLDFYNIDKNIHNFDIKRITAKVAMVKY